MKKLSCLDGGIYYHEQCLKEFNIAKKDLKFFYSFFNELSQNDFSNFNGGIIGFCKIKDKIKLDVNVNNKFKFIFGD